MGGEILRTLFYYYHIRRTKRKQGAICTKRCKLHFRCLAAQPNTPENKRGVGLHFRGVKLSEHLLNICLAKFLCYFLSRKHQKMRSDCVNIVIIGNSAAGLSALQNFRKVDKDSKVVMISKEGFLP